jgi:hypothetical protein
MFFISATDSTLVIEIMERLVYHGISDKNGYNPFNIMFTRKMEERWKEDFLLPSP